MVAFRKSYLAISRVQRVPRRLSDDTIRYHHYHRPTKTPLPAPDDPAFKAAYEAAERKFAEQQAALQAAAPPLQPLPERAPEPRPAQSSNQPAEAAQLRPAAPPAAPKLVTRNSAHRGQPASPAQRLSILRRRRAAVTQAEIARVIRAAKQAGATQVEVRLNDSSSVIVRLQPDNSLDSEEIIL